MFIHFSCNKTVARLQQYMVVLSFTLFLVQGLSSNLIQGNGHTCLVTFGVYQINIDIIIGMYSACHSPDHIQISFHIATCGSKLFCCGIRYWYDDMQLSGVGCVSVWQHACMSCMLLVWWFMSSLSTPLSRLCAKGHVVYNGIYTCHVCCGHSLPSVSCE